jgi:hypothetical protein
VKAYVLFKKKDKGVALTLSKKKAKVEEVDQGSAETIEGAYMPNDEELDGIVSNEKYSTMMKATKDASLVGSVSQFRILEENAKYCVVKSLDAVKKSKNFIGVVPKCLCGSRDMTNHESTFKGLILDHYRGQIPLISIQPELIELKDSILSQDELALSSSYIGVVNGIIGQSGAVGVRFMNGI